MNEHFSTKTPAQHMLETIRRFSAQYGLAYIKCAIIKDDDDDEQYLHFAEVKIQHKNDQLIEEKIQEYENIILAVIPLTLDELESVIKELDLGKINLKSLGRINAENGFEQSYEHVSSRTRYNGYYNDWPSYCFRASLNEQKTFSKMSRRLIKLGLPAYPNFFEAFKVFFQPTQDLNHYNPTIVNFMIPNYDARISLLKIAGDQISVSVECKEISLGDLVVQIFCKASDVKYQHSGDLKFDDAGMIKFSADFEPNHIYVYLLDSKNNKSIDSKSFDPYYIHITDGIKVDTSIEILEEVLAAGENKRVEFKHTLDGNHNEFLESVVSFANTEGGKILLGINDNGTVAGVKEDFRKIYHRIPSLVNSNCKPDIDVDIDQVFLKNKSVIIINVKEGKDKPYMLSNKSAYKRVGESDRVFERSDFDNVYSQKQSALNGKNFGSVKRL